MVWSTSTADTAPDPSHTPEAAPSLNAWGIYCLMSSISACDNSYSVLFPCLIRHTPTYFVFANVQVNIMVTGDKSLSLPRLFALLSVYFPAKTGKVVAAVGHHNHPCPCPISFTAVSQKKNRATAHPLLSRFMIHVEIKESVSVV